VGIETLRFNDNRNVVGEQSLAYSNRKLLANESEVSTQPDALEDLAK
jgi:hypothetical protein